MIRKAVLLLSMAAAGFAATSCRFFLINPLEIVAWAPDQERVTISGVQAVTIRFSTEVDQILAEQAFSLTESGAPLAGNFEWVDNREFDFSPSIQLKEGPTYTIKVDTSAEDLHGNSLQKEFRHSFSSRNESERPQVMQISPADYAAIDDLSASIVITFSESMDPTTVSDGFGLSPATDGYMIWDAAVQVFEFILTEEYSWQTDYLITLENSVADDQGNTLTDSVRSHFFVGTESVAPLLISAENEAGTLTVVPDDNAGTLVFTEGWEKNMPLVLTFDEAMNTDTTTGALSWSPDFQTDAVWSSGDTILTITPAGTLTWETVYSLTISETLTDTHGNALQMTGPLRIRITGSESRPPQVVKVAFLNIFSPVDDVVELLSFAPLAFDAAYALPPAGNYLDTGNSFVDVYFFLAEGAEIDYFSLIDTFSISCENASLTPLALQIDAAAVYFVNDPVPPQLPYGQPDYHIARFVLGVDNSGVVYENVPGLLTISVGSEFQDSLNNPMGTPWQMTVVTTN